MRKLIMMAKHHLVFYDKNRKFFVNIFHSNESRIVFIKARSVGWLFLEACFLGRRRPGLN